MQDLKSYVYQEVRAKRLSVDTAAELLERAVSSAAKVVRSNDIAVIGLSGRFPQADDLEEFWRVLNGGVDCIGEVPAERWGLEGFYSEEAAAARASGTSVSKWGGFLKDIEHADLEFFGISPAEARILDPREILYLEVAWHALEAAGYTRESLKQSADNRVGVFVGAMSGTGNYFGAGNRRNAVIPSLSIATIPNRVSRVFGFQGPSVAIDTQSSSSMTALHMACQSLLSGECRLALAGGVTLLYPELFTFLTQAGTLASDPASRSYSNGEGLLLAEAAGAMLLKPKDQAVADGDVILAVIRGTAANHGGDLGPGLLPNASAQSRLVAELLERVGAEAGSLGCIETAANGSPMGDLIEVAALSRALRGGGAQEGSIMLTSVKATIGHAEAASGFTQLTKAILQLRHGVLVPGNVPATINPGLVLAGTPFTLLREATPWPRIPDESASNGVLPRRALVTSFGAGGSYAAALLDEHVVPQQSQDRARARDEQAQLVVVSARNMDRLSAAVHRLATFVKDNEDIRLADLAHTLQVGREAMSFRWATVVRNRDELLRALSAVPATGHGATAPPNAPAWPVFLGNTNDQQIELGRWLDEQAQETLLRRYLQDGDLERLAACWVGGARVPWSSMGRKMALPGYPFARVRFTDGNPLPPIAPGVERGKGTPQDRAQAPAAAESLT
jgi:polyketide synthase PksN